MTSGRTPLPVARGLREIGDHVTAWRRLRGLTQEQAAERAGVSRATLQRLERGTGSTSVEALVRVLRALGLADVLPRALDPLATDIGRMRAAEDLPRRVRPRDLTGGDA